MSVRIMYLNPERGELTFDIQGIVTVTQKKEEISFLTTEARFGELLKALGGANLIRLIMGDEDGDGSKLYVRENEERLPVQECTMEERPMDSLKLIYIAPSVTRKKSPKRKSKKSDSNPRWTWSGNIKTQI